MFLDMKLSRYALFCLSGYACFFMISVAVSNFFLVGSVLFSLALYIKNRDVLLMPAHYVRAFCVFFLIMFILACFSEPLGIAMERYMKTLLRLAILLVVMINVKKESEIINLLLCVTFSIFIADCFVLYQAFQGNFRAQGFFSHPMYFAGLAVQFLPMLFLLFFKAQGKVKVWIGILFFISFMALLANGTRGAWLAILIMLPGALIFAYNRMKEVVIGIVLLIFLCMATFFTIPGLHNRLTTLSDLSYQSNSERLLLWSSAWNMFKDHPLTGVGYGNFQYYYKNFYISPDAKEPELGHAHNNFINNLAETGVVGSFAFLFLWGSFFYYAYRDWRKTGDYYALIFFNAVMGVFLQGMTESNAGNSVVMNYFYFLMGIYLVSLNNRSSTASR